MQCALDSVLGRRGVNTSPMFCLTAAQRIVCSKMPLQPCFIRLVTGLLTTCWSQKKHFEITLSVQLQTTWLALARFILGSLILPMLPARRKAPRLMSWMLFS